ncbi:alpha/beta-hydrolase [Auricularia subglabra TFB-10046 SS5]|nr:alpha/beta-hydrolase [Auricularia subglabra TFB-10046 SS5]
MWHSLQVGLALAAAVVAQRPPQTIPNSFPHNYTGIPKGDYSTEWQDYFRVDASALPNITFELPRSFAGNIATGRPGHPNDTLFFWAFEQTEGSLTGNASDDDPWLVWLNGGPGSSSFLGFLFENGPIHIDNDLGAYKNNFSWDRYADAVWVDQPVGTGFSTADTTGYIADEDQMGEDFVGFLANLVKVFPSLATRPFHLTGESYAGMYIPYITKTILATQNPPVKLAKVAIGDGAIGSLATFEELPALSVIETYPQIIDFDPEAFEYFRTQTHLCVFDLNLTYPQNGLFPTLDLVAPSADFRKEYFAERTLSTALRREDWRAEIAARYRSRPALKKRDRTRQLDMWKRDVSQRANGTIDPFYGCFLFDEMLDYAANFTFPWTDGDWDVYEIPDALNPETPQNGAVFMNDDSTRAALHAPTSKNWTSSFRYPFGSTRTRAPNANEFGDPSVEAVVLLTGIASGGVPIVFYSGNADALVAHRGTEVVIQNFTFGGTQGFSHKPSTPWFGDDGAFAGIVHQERNVTFVLFDNAGHLVPQWQPEHAAIFLREFVLGQNTTGLVMPDGSVVGGENATLSMDYLPAFERPIFYGSATSQFSTIWPKATINAWEKFIASALAEPTTTAASTATLSSSTVIVTQTTPSSSETDTITQPGTPTTTTSGATRSASQVGLRVALAALGMIVYTL